MFDLLLILLIVVVAFFGINWLMGYRKETITIDLDDRYTNLKEYVKAVELELIRQGKDVKYEGNRSFLIEGKRYTLFEQNIPVGGVPLQRTILKREKE